MHDVLRGITAGRKQRDGLKPCAGTRSKQSPLSAPTWTRFQKLATGIPMTPRLQNLLGQLEEVVHDEMLRYYDDSGVRGICLETARCLRIVLRHFGFNANPLSVFIHIHNPITTEVLHTNSHLAKPELLRLVEKSWDAGGWSTGSRANPGNGNPLIDPNGGYNAHLVIRVQDVLIDAAIKQYERVQHNILLPRLLATPATPLFDRGEPNQCMVNGCLIVHVRSGDQQFRNMPGWSKQGGKISKKCHDIIERKIVNEIIDKVNRNMRPEESVELNTCPQSNSVVCEERHSPGKRRQ
jgi:hypothetical protein